MSSEDEEVLVKEMRNEIPNIQNVVFIKELPKSSDSTSCTESSSDELNIDKRQDTKSVKQSPLFGRVQKLIRYLKTGNPTASVMVLSCLKDENFWSKDAIEAIRENDGLQTLINLLEAEDKKCKIATAAIVKVLSAERNVAKELIDLGIIPILVQLLDDDLTQLKLLVTEIIANLVTVRKGRKLIRKTGGIVKMIQLLECRHTILITPREDLRAKDAQKLDILCSCCKVLWKTSQTKKGVEEICKQNIIKTLSRLLKSCYVDIIVPVLGVTAQCSSQSQFQMDIQKEGMIGDIVKYLRNKNDKIKTHCAYAIFKCSEDVASSNLVRQYGGLDPLVELLEVDSISEKSALLSATTGALWKCSRNRRNLQRLNELDALTKLTRHLHIESDEILTNVIGAIAECVKLHQNQEILRKSECIPTIVNLLNRMYEPLLKNLCQFLTTCSENLECMDVIIANDGIRLLWSLLRNSSPEVQECAAWTLVPFVQNAKDSSEIIRNFTGGLELLVSLLSSSNERVLTSVCAATAEIAKNPENLAIVTDLGVVEHLSRLVKTKDENLREHLSAAIANCCISQQNCHNFGMLNAVKPLIKYLKAPQENVQRFSALALYRLSQDPMNCVTMHKNEIVKLLLKTIASTDEELQESSAGCLSNIRNFILQQKSL